MCNFLILLLFTKKMKLLDIFMNRVYFDSCTPLQIYIYYEYCKLNVCIQGASNKFLKLELDL